MIISECTNIKNFKRKFFFFHDIWIYPFMNINKRGYFKFYFSNAVLAIYSVFRTPCNISLYIHINFFIKNISYFWGIFESEVPGHVCKLFCYKLFLLYLCCLCWCGRSINFHLVVRPSKILGTLALQHKKWKVRDWYDGGLISFRPDSESTRFST